MHNRGNFIRLYPTPATVRRYQPITQSRNMEEPEGGGVVIEDGV